MIKKLYIRFLQGQFNTNSTSLTIQVVNKTSLGYEIGIFCEEFGELFQIIAARRVLEAHKMTGIVCAVTNCSVLEVKINRTDL